MENFKFYKNPLSEDLPNEDWRTISGIDKKYQVSSLGRVRVIENGISILNQSKNSGGYLSVRMNTKNGVKTHKVHRLVAIAFIHNPRLKPIVNHKNGERDANWVSNLEWGTYQENRIHAIYRAKRGGRKISIDEIRLEIERNEVEANLPAFSLLSIGCILTLVPVFYSLNLMLVEFLPTSASVFVLGLTVFLTMWRFCIRNKMIAYYMTG